MKTQESMVSFRGIGKAKIFEKQWIHIDNHYQNLMTHIMNHANRWLSVRISIYNTFTLIICMLLPIITVNYFAWLFGDIGSSSGRKWKIPLALTWSYKVVALTSKLASQLAVIANDMTSAVRLKEYITLQEKHDQGVGISNYIKFDTSNDKTLAVEI